MSERKPAKRHASDAADADGLAPRLVQLARLFFTLGVVGFGGPAAHIAMMEEEVVQKRGWLTPQGFLDLVGATNLIPGPNSTEMTMHVGYARAGWVGLLVAGVSFIVPAAALTLALAWLYVETASIPQAAAWIGGIEPVVLVLIGVAVVRLGRKAVHSWHLAAISLGVTSAVLFGVSEVPALFIGTFAGACFLLATKRSGGADSKPPSVRPSVSNKAKWVLAASVGVAGATAGEPTLEAIGYVFLKIGAILYGSGYVLIAFLESDLVQRLGWMTQSELLDAVAIGQLTPGPVLTTATAVGYIIAGVPGALVATAAIFLPSFVFAGLLHPVVPRIRSSRVLSAGLDAVNAAAVALMAVVCLRLAAGALDTPTHWAIAGLSIAAVLSGKVPMPFLIAAGAVAGGVSGLLFG